MDETGTMKPEIIETFGCGETYESLTADRGKNAVVLLAALNKILPYTVICTHVVDIQECGEWMKENVHDGWQIIFDGDKNKFRFARWPDALNFKMAWT